MMRLSTFCLTLFFPALVLARIYVPIDQPSDKKLPIAITELVKLSGGVGHEAREIPAIIQRNLEISAYFQFIPPDAFLEAKGNGALTAGTIAFEQWTSIEAQALIKGSILKDRGTLVVELRLFDPFLKTMLVGKRYRASENNIRYIAHRFADEVMEALTGIRGPFNSKITYTVPTGKGNKAIAVGDFDGHNLFTIVQQKTISLGSKFSADGSRVIFTSYASGRPEIYVAALGGKVRQLTHNRQTNITPTFDPWGRNIVFSSSLQGSPNLWMMDSSGRVIARLTHTPDIDLAPSYSPDGSQIVFSSERAGNLHVFKMNADGTNIQRLTFVGHYNDTPVWSPDGQKIAFCAQDKGPFDIFVMNPDGSFIQRLTRGEGSNTHPSWSPDSRYLTFSSTRDGDAVYVMRFDGEAQTRVSKGAGILPSWGPRLD